MNDKYLSIITNFGCHYSCPECIVRNNKLKMTPTEEYSSCGLLYCALTHECADCNWVSVSGGGDPLYHWWIHQRWWNGFFSMCTMKDGIEYDDASVQAAINKSFVAERNDEAQEIENQTKISKANAEAEANKIISESLTDRLIQQQMYEKWDGKLPTYVGGDASIPVLNDMK